MSKPLCWQRVLIPLPRRLAINSTDSLYGADVHLSYRLLRRVIQNELHQTGLNLTHKQDRHFLRNLCEVTSALLDPRYSTAWNRIAEEDQGPEQLLKLYNQYAQVLIDNQRDTFTEPFEISTKWFVFGLDTISTGQLWDVHKSGDGGVRSSFASNSGSRTARRIQHPVTHGSSSHLLFNVTPSVYLDFSLGSELASANGPSDESSASVSPSVTIPKYNNFPMRKSNVDDVTRAIIPLKLLNVPTMSEAASSVLSPTPGVFEYKSRASLLGQNALVAYTIFNSLATFLPSNTDSTVK